MASLIPVYQSFEQVKRDVQSFGIHKVILASSSDTVTVPNLADPTTPSNSVAELDDGNNGTGTTVSTSNVRTVTITGGKNGDVVWFVTRHRGRTDNMPEAA